MDFDEYQKKAAEFDFFEESDNFLAPGFLEKVLGLSGEAGETVDKVKKIIRDKDGKPTEEDKMEIAKELGDTLWYIAGVARYLDIPMSKIASNNIAKLASRKERGKLHGSGDNR